LESGTPPEGVFADAVDRIVVVGREQERGVARKRIGLTYEFERPCSVGREDAEVVLGGVEEVEHLGPRFLHEFGRHRGSRVDRVGIAMHAGQQAAHVADDLGRTVEATSGVVEVDLPLLIEAGEFIAPQLFEGAVMGQLSLGELAQQEGVQRTGHGAKDLGAIGEPNVPLFLPIRYANRQRPG